MINALAELRSIDVFTSIIFHNMIMQTEMKVDEASNKIHVFSSNGPFSMIFQGLDFGFFLVSPQGYIIRPFKCCI